MRLQIKIVAGGLVVVLLVSQWTLAASATQPALCKCESVRPLSLSSPFLTGFDIVEFQERLARLGFYYGPMDGVYGPISAKR